MKYFWTPFPDRFKEAKEGELLAVKILDECIESSYFSGAGDKIKWRPYGKCTFTKNVLGQMQVFRNTLTG